MTTSHTLSHTKRRPPLYRLKQNATGAPALNTNHATHGLHSRNLIARVQLNQFPVQWRQAGKQASELRRALEDECQRVHGEVTRAHALTINTASKWELIGALAARWLREHHDKLSPVELLHFATTIGKSSERRDAAVTLLNIDNAVCDPLKALRQQYMPLAATQTTQDVSGVASDALDSPESIVDDLDSATNLESLRNLEDGVL